MDRDVVVNERISGKNQKANVLFGVNWCREKKTEVEGQKAGSGDYSVPPRSQWCATDTHQGVRWQNALSINMLLRRNKTPPRASTLHANFIRAAMEERHLCMQMRELSISKLQLVPAKCVIMDVGCLCCNNLLNVWSLSNRILQWICAWILRIFGLLQKEVCLKWCIYKLIEKQRKILAKYSA